ncbi:MAG: pyrroloquinoline quinone-dependent dehydrogenase [Halioglobus sp.]|nr:pyrroloquinoline quinone-dependent dehydrogenase [Halioglobus sp.]
MWGGDPAGTRFSPLQEITPANVDMLSVAWQYHTGDSSVLQPDMPASSFLATPVLHDNTLYFCSGFSRAFAVDAETGRERWVFDSHPDTAGVETAKCRGVALWHDKRAQDKAPCRTRVFMGTMDGRLVAIDADSGAACADFGEGGAVDLKSGLGLVLPGEMAMTSPPVVINDVIVQGAMVKDNSRLNSPGGVIRAWDARTGRLRWAFDPVAPGSPSPRLLGAPVGQLYHSGTANSWGVAAADPARNLVFVPFGSPGLDFVGGHRQQGGVDVDYYANAVVALDAATGQVEWSFQTVHHDLWDYDIAAQPVLIDLEQDGDVLPALVQATKMGHLFILHRETGVPLYPVEERPVPQTRVPGEYTSPTQPFPTFPQPLHPQRIDAADAWGLTPYDLDACRAKIEAAENDGIFTPPALHKHVLIYPGVAGGQNWGGLAYDPVNNLLVMPQNYVVTHNKLLPREPVDVAEGNQLEIPSRHLGAAPYVVQHEVLLSPFGIPCIAPPWGSLLAVSLATGKKVWEVPLGTPRDMLPALAWFPLFPTMGLPSAGGALVTASQLAFLGASLDNYIRAFSTADGRELWRHRLPAGGQAVPMTYTGEKSGRQFVVIAAGGHAYMRTTLGDTLVAFSLKK